MAFAPPKSQLIDSPSAFLFLSALAWRGPTPTYSSVYFLLWEASQREHNLCCLDSECNPHQHW